MAQNEGLTRAGIIKTIEDWNKTCPRGEAIITVTARSWGASIPPPDCERSLALKKRLANVRALAELLPPGTPMQGLLLRLTEEE